MSLDTQIDTLRADLSAAIAAATDDAALDAVRVAALGKKGSVSALLASLEVEVDSALAGASLQTPAEPPDPSPAPREGALVAEPANAPFLAGTVRTPFGEPLAAARVHVEDASDGSERTTLSDALGHF